MKPNAIAVLQLSQMNSSEKIAKGQFIDQQWALYGQSFPTTAPNTAIDRRKATDRLAAAHAAAQGGGKLAAAEEKAASLAFDQLFGPYRDWANQPDVALGDETRIMQLGLDVSHQAAQRASQLPAPVLKPLAGTNEGELIAACESMDGAKAYLVLVAYSDEVPTEKDYVYCTSGTRPKFTLPLDSGKIAWVVFIAVGVQGPSPRSLPQKRRVL